MNITQLFAKELLHGLCAFYFMQTLTLNSEIPQFWQPWNCFTSLFTSTCSLLDKLLSEPQISIAVYISVLWTTTTHSLTSSLLLTLSVLWSFCLWKHHWMCFLFLVENASYHRAFRHFMRGNCHKKKDKLGLSIK